MSWIYERCTLRKSHWVGLGFPEAQLIYENGVLAVLIGREISSPEEERFSHILRHSLPVREWNTPVIFEAS